MHHFTKKLKQKGWTLKELAERWGLQQRQMSNIAADPKQIHWDALLGLPPRLTVKRPRKVAL